MKAINNKAKKILFLGYDDKETRLHHILRDRACQIEQASEPVFDFEGYDLIISVGFKHIIPKEVIQKSCPIINLHISLLPYNRGRHPNFWSHFDNTPCGVTIHLIDEGIDTGPYLFQKRVDFNVKNLTFKESYQILINEIENLFIHNVEEILSLDFKPKSYTERGTYHNSYDLPDTVDWNNLIFDQIKALKKG